ncbi:conserved exported protein of unknown function [Pararobbsia alpina]
MNTMTVSLSARRALVTFCALSLPLVAMADEASSPTANDPQVGASAPHHTMKHKKATTSGYSNSTGGASNSGNAIGAGNGAPSNNSGSPTAPMKGTGGGN